MKKLFLFIILCLVSCLGIQKDLTTETYYNKNFSIEQVDSIIKAEHVDHLDSIPIIGKDKKYYEYFYIKDSLVLRFIDKGDSVKVTKRINK